ncbi:WD40/YVTN/BNR-like repeat-containing protein [Horticoccus sp. 23ND18S-11]|uniref:WD40/YVTN/BNR-like repeat-containing protein n=1 Tax=Horticoccus sp. 23ND18S-11 TaxID=3391832 RepID=UPI0039C9AE58
MTPLRFLTLALLGWFSLGAPTAMPAAEFPGTAQPQLAANASGHVWIALGRGKDIGVAHSRDGGDTFDPVERVATLPALMVGRRRGPRIVAHGDRVTVTAMAGEFFAFHSKDAGKTWAGPALINDVRGSAREGLNGLAVAPDGRLFAVWLDHRGERTQLFAAESADGGASWSANTRVYQAPAGSTVCECCHPSAHFNARGDLAVMWRNAIDGARDMWIAVRPAGSRAFDEATKLGTGTWQLKACPMDGGALFAPNDAFATIWQRNGAVFTARRGEPEQTLGPGTQPVALVTGTRSVAVWQQGADLWSAPLDGTRVSGLLARQARFPSLIAVPGSHRILVAYERGADSVVAAIGEPATTSSGAKARDSQPASAVASAPPPPATPHAAQH